MRVDPNGDQKRSSEDIEECSILNNADLSEAKLTNGTINRAVLNSVILARTNLLGFDLKNLNLSQANLSLADIRGADFSGSVLDGALLFEAHAEGASFSNARMRGADLADAYFDGGNLTNANLSGALLSGTSLQGAEMSGALLFGANLSTAHVWQTKPSAEQAYSLAILSDLKVVEPRPEDLLRFEQSMDALKADQIDHGPSVAMQRLSSLLDASNRGDWKDTGDAQKWYALVSSNRASPMAYENLGVFLGKLACSDPTVFAGVVRAHFWLTPSYVSYIEYSPLPVLPPDVSVEDIAQIQGDGGYVTTSDNSVRYLNKPEIVLGFHNEIKKQENCRGSASDQSSTLSDLETMIASAKTTAVKSSGSVFPK